MRLRARTGRDASGPRPARAHYAVLRSASRLRRWVLVGAVAGANGAVVQLRLGWWPGLIAAGLVAAGLLIWDYWSGMLGSWPGDRGCHRLVAAAARLERHGWAVLRSPAVPGQDLAEVYLFIGPGGVFVVEHQVWSFADRVATNPRTGLLESGDRPAARRTTTVRAATAVVDEALADVLTDVLSLAVPVHPVLAIHGLTVDRPHATIGVSIVPIADLVRVIRASPARLTPTEADTVASAARRLFTPGTIP